MQLTPQGCPTILKSILSWTSYTFQPSKHTLCLLGGIPLSCLDFLLYEDESAELCFIFL